MPRKADLPSLGCASSSDCETVDITEASSDEHQTFTFHNENTRRSMAPSSDGKYTGIQVLDAAYSEMSPRSDAEYNIEMIHTADDPGFIDTVDRCVEFESRYCQVVKSGWNCMGTDFARDSQDVDGLNDKPPTPATPTRSLHSYPQKRLARLRRLKNSMTIPAKTVGVETSQEQGHSVIVKKAYSLDERSRPQQKKRPTPKTENKSFQKMFLWRFTCAQCNDLEKAVADDETFDQMRTLMEDELAYDSDPEEFYSWRGANINPTVSEIRRSLDSVGGNRKANVNQTSRIKARDMGRTPDAAYARNEGQFDSEKITREEREARFLKEMSHGDLSLVWHPSNGEKPNHRNPTAVKAWVELGCRLKETVVQPKFMWRSAIHKVMDAPLSTPKGMAIGTPEHTGSIDLLDIARVLKTRNIDRERLPFAMKKKCFSIISLDHKEFIFETATTGERDRIVNGLKLLVARLASKIIVGDDSVFADFFHPMEAPRQRRLLKKILA